MNQSIPAYAWVVSHIWMIMSHMWMRHVAHMNESCRTHEWVMSHTWMIHVAHMNDSCRTHEWVMSHTWMSHVLGAQSGQTCRTCSSLLWGRRWWGDQCVAACCSLLHFVVVCCRVLHLVATCCSVSQFVAMCCSLLQRDATCTTCSPILWGRRWWGGRCVAACCSLLQCAVM